MRNLVLGLACLATLSSTAHAAESAFAPATVKKFLELGGPKKALGHLGCVLKTLGTERFPLKQISEKEDSLGTAKRCNNFENGQPVISINNKRYAVIIDFTKNSKARRLFLLSLEKPGEVTSHYVAHGRFGETLRSNKEPTKNGNTILDVKLFDNRPNWNASSTGLYITGRPYKGKYAGKKKDKYSLVLFGVEKEVNDNVCRRAVVIHGTKFISEKGENEGVHWMSSGCPMVDYDLVNELIAKIRGTDRAGGAAMLVYGPREAKLDQNYYCNLRPGQNPGEGAEEEAQEEEKPAAPAPQPQPQPKEEPAKKEEPILNEETDQSNQ